MNVKKLTDRIANFVWSGAFARFPGPGVVDRYYTELKLTAFNQVWNGESRAGDRLGVYWRPVAMAFHW